MIIMQKKIITITTLDYLYKIGNSKNIISFIKKIFFFEFLKTCKDTFQIFIFDKFLHVLKPVLTRSMLPKIFLSFKRASLPLCGNAWLVFTLTGWKRETGNLLNGNKKRDFSHFSDMIFPYFLVYEWISFI